MVATQRELQPLLDIYFNDQLDQFNRDYSYIAKSGFSNKVDEGADYTVFTQNQGDNMSLTTVKRGAAFTVTEDLIVANKYREALESMRDLGARMFRGIALDATHVLFTQGFSASYTDRDGKTVTNSIAKTASGEPIFDDTHTMADGSTFDNELAAATIGESNLRALQDLTTTFVDENGQLVVWGRGPKILVTGIDAGMNHAAQRLTEQEWNYNSTNRDMNVFKGTYRHLPLAYLATGVAGGVSTTEQYYYYILDQELSRDSAILGVRQAPKLHDPQEDIYNGGIIWRSNAWYDLGVLYAHLGAGCPATS